MKISDSVNVVELKNKISAKASEPIVNSQSEKKSSVGKYVLGGLGATAAIAVALLALKKGKAPQNISINAGQKVVNVKNIFQYVVLIKKKCSKRHCVPVLSIFYFYVAKLRQHSFVIFIKKII